MAASRPAKSPREAVNRKVGGKVNHFFDLFRAIPIGQFMAIRLKAFGKKTVRNFARQGASMIQPGKTLMQLRKAIDDIDDRIHDLLMARADLAGQIRTAKQRAAGIEGGDMGSAYRPAR